MANGCAPGNPYAKHVYSRRQPEKTPLYQVFQRHLPAFERMWTDSESGGCLPKFVTGELQAFLRCGILAYGFAQMHCDECRKRHLVAFSCKCRGFCPSCMGRRMNEGAANLVDHALPEGIPLRQWVLTLPHPLRYPLAFDAGHLGKVLRLFTSTVSSWYTRGHSGGKTGSVTVIQRASSDLRLNPHFHTLFLDGAYRPGPDGEAPVFEPAPTPTQEDIEAVVTRARKRILRYLEKQGVVAFAAAPGDGEVHAQVDETLGESSPALATLMAAATVGAAPAGPALRRAPIQLSPCTQGGPDPKGYLCAQDAAFNLHAARRVAPNDRQGREMLCRYILRPPLANERFHLMEDGMVTVEFKRPWKDGTRSIASEPKALLSRLSAIVPPPRRHVTVYSGVLSSGSSWRSLVVPGYKEENPEDPTPAAKGRLPPSGEPVHPSAAQEETRSGEAAVRSRYIPWKELLRRTFGSEVVCPDCGGRLRLVALVKTEASIQMLLAAFHLPTGPPKVAAAEQPPGEEGLEWRGEVGEADWVD
ncbi:MAG: transposase [Fibrobacteria bacterium]